MLRGELYIADDPVIQADQARTADLLERYNATGHSEQEERDRILRELLGEMGEGVVIRPTFRCDYGTYISIGARTFVNFDCVMLDVAAIRVGESCQLATKVQLLTATHPVDPEPRRLHCHPRPSRGRRRLREPGARRSRDRRGGPDSGSWALGRPRLLRWPSTNERSRSWARGRSARRSSGASSPPAGATPPRSSPRRVARGAPPSCGSATGSRSRSRTQKPAPAPRSWSSPSSRRTSRLCSARSAR